MSTTTRPSVSSARSVAVHRWRPDNPLTAHTPDADVAQLGGGARKP
jgi:hypothetical protein